MPAKNDNEEDKFESIFVLSRTQFSQLRDNEFEFRGGCTLIFDLDSPAVEIWLLSKPLLDMESAEKDGEPKINMKRLQNQYNFQHGDEDSGINEYTLYFEIRIAAHHRTICISSPTLNFLYGNYKKESCQKEIRQ